MTRQDQATSGGAFAGEAVGAPQGGSALGTAACAVVSNGIGQEVTKPK